MTSTILVLFKAKAKAFFPFVNSVETADLSLENLRFLTNSNLNEVFKERLW